MEISTDEQQDNLPVFQYTLSPKDVATSKGIRGRTYTTLTWSVANDSTPEPLVSKSIITSSVMSTKPLIGSSNKGHLSKMDSLDVDTAIVSVIQTETPKNEQEDQSPAIQHPETVTMDTTLSDYSPSEVKLDVEIKSDMAPLEANSTHLSTPMEAPSTRKRSKKRMKSFYYGAGSESFNVSNNDDEKVLVEDGYEPGILGHNPFADKRREERYFVLNQYQYRWSFRFMLVVAFVANIAMGASELMNSYAGWETDMDQVPYLLSLRAHQFIHACVTMYFSQDRFIHYNDVNRALYTTALALNCLLVSAIGDEPSFGVYGCMVFSLFVVTGLHLLFSLTLGYVVAASYVLLRYYVSVRAFVCPVNLASTPEGQILCDNRYIHMETELYSYFIYFSIIILTMAVSMALTNRNSRFAFLERERLRSEQGRTNALLNNILPTTIANRLISGKDATNTSAQPSGIHGVVCAQKVKSCSIMFCEISNFKSLTFDIHPSELVLLLNTIFSKYDSLVERYNVYKVETVGEIYMVASGVPEAIEFHTLALCALAIEMRAVSNLLTINKHSKLPLSQLQLPVGNELSSNESQSQSQPQCLEQTVILPRFGIHAGELVAGTVGVKLPRYRLFGDTVNTASRMQSSAEPNMIQLSKTAFLNVGPLKCLKVRPRGTVEVKGKGMMYTYFVDGFTDSSSDPTFAKDVDGSAKITSEPFNFSNPASVSFPACSPLATLFPSLVSHERSQELSQFQDSPLPENDPVQYSEDIDESSSRTCCKKKEETPSLRFDYYRKRQRYCRMPFSSKLDDNDSDDDSEDDGEEEVVDQNGAKDENLHHASSLAKPKSKHSTLSLFGILDSVARRQVQLETFHKKQTLNSRLKQSHVGSEDGEIQKTLLSAYESSDDVSSVPVADDVIPSYLVTNKF